MSNSAELGGQRGLLFIVSSPSGAGKTTLCRRLQTEFPELSFSVSVTTRSPRTGEVEGSDYTFVEEERFNEMVARGEFAEWAEVHGNRYGTAWETIRKNVNAGRDVLFDIDWQGATALHSDEEFGSDTVMVFVLPPSIGELARRLRGRGTDVREVVDRRLAKARDELGHFGEYRYLVFNDDLETAYRDLRAIYLAEHCVATRRRSQAQRLLEEARLSP
ncbi:MAG: guanylate kinase [Deltaproteobacteria bacterium]|nr:guanylate kinase [Deltaproteobacteria bacterium]